LKRNRYSADIKWTILGLLDFAIKIIYELRPNNPREIKVGEKQLKNYKAAFLKKLIIILFGQLFLDTYLYGKKRY
jgi:hypothetical protein